MELSIEMKTDAIYLCSPAHGNCCCGNVEKGMMPIDWSAWIGAWCSHPVSMHLPLVPMKCLGPCQAANVMLIRSRGREYWLHHVCADHMSVVLSFALRTVRSIEPATGRDVAELLFRPGTTMQLFAS
jgi:hypothetical protein